MIAWNFLEIENTRADDYIKKKKKILNSMISWFRSRLSTRNLIGFLTWFRLDEQIEIRLIRIMLRFSHSHSSMFSKTLSCAQTFSLSTTWINKYRLMALIQNSLKLWNRERKICRFDYAFYFFKSKKFPKSSK